MIEITPCPDSPSMLCVSRAVYDVIRIWADERGCSMSEIVALLVVDELLRQDGTGVRNG